MLLTDPNFIANVRAACALAPINSPLYNVSWSWDESEIVCVVATCPTVEAAVAALCSDIARTPEE